MTGSRRLARRLAFLTLFELEERPNSSLDEALEPRRIALEEESGTRLDPRYITFARSLVAGATAHRTKIDQRIQQTAPAFPIEQLAITDRVSLQLGLYELLYERDASIRVVINEAVVLAKTYGGENSGRFVNGVLGTIAEGMTDLDAPATTATHSET